MSPTTDHPATANRALLVFAGGRWRATLAARQLRAAGLSADTRRGRRQTVLTVEVPVASTEVLELVQTVTGRDPRIRLLHRSDLPPHVDLPSRNRGRDERRS